MIWRSFRGRQGARSALLIVALAVSGPRSIMASVPGQAASQETKRGSPRALPHADFQRELDAGLAHYAARRFAEARDAFLRALSLLRGPDGRANLEFDIAACEYELGHFEEAEQRFMRVAELDPSALSDARLHAAWAALAAGDTDGAEKHLGAAGDMTPGERQRELRAAIDETRRQRAAAELDEALERAAAAYDAGELAAADTALGAAREHETAGSSRTRATLEYLTALIANERGDERATREALARCLGHDPNDGAAFALLGELSRRDGDGASAERHYRASLATDLTPADADTVQSALDSLYALPPRGVAAWAALGAGYDSNATQSGSSEALGYATPGRTGSPFVAPAWGLEYRLPSSPHSRLGVYYAGDWLVLGNPDVEDFSLQTHEAGVRFYLALSRAVDLRLAAGGGATFSGLELSPFSLDAVLGARLSMRHGAGFASVLSAEARPTLGLPGREYLSGVRSDVSFSERFDSGRFGAALMLGYRHIAVGTESIGVDPTRFPRCNLACADARYRIPLGYTGPILGAGVELDVTAALSLGITGKYEHRTYLDASRIEGSGLPALLTELSEKTRRDDRFSLGSRARYQLGSAPAVGVYLDYSLRLSLSNVAYRPRDLEHAFDYDDRNFTQHLIELGADLRL